MASDGGVTRFQIEDVTHRNGQQFISGRGLAGERFKDVHRFESFGDASYPVSGGIGLLVQSRSNRDSVYMIGGQVPSTRPSGDLLTQGGRAIYDAAGNIVSIVAANLRIVHSTEIRLVAPMIVLEGLVKLGGDDADRPAAALGSVDTDGDSEVGNLATMVLVK